MSIDFKKVNLLTAVSALISDDLLYVTRQTPALSSHNINFSDLQTQLANFANSSLTGDIQTLSASVTSLNTTTNIHTSQVSYLSAELDIDTTQINYISAQVDSIRPAGSDGEIQFKTGDIFNADSNLVFDDTNKRMGIGTASPSERLHVVDNLRIDGQAYSSSVILSADLSAIVETDCNRANVFILTLSGNYTLQNPTNLNPGATYIWEFIQDSVGGHILTFDTAFKIPRSAPRTLTTLSGSIDILTGVTDGTNIYCVLTRDYIQV